MGRLERPIYELHTKIKGPNVGRVLPPPDWIYPIDDNGKVLKPVAGAEDVYKETPFSQKYKKVVEIQEGMTAQDRDRNI